MQLRRPSPLSISITIFGSPTMPMDTCCCLIRDYVANCSRSRVCDALYGAYVFVVGVRKSKKKKKKTAGDGTYNSVPPSRVAFA